MIKITTEISLKRCFLLRFSTSDSRELLIGSQLTGAPSTQQEVKGTIWVMMDGQQMIQMQAPCSQRKCSCEEQRSVLNLRFYGAALFKI